ncbi:flavoprotein [Streptomyces longispororuber]|nr:flavoprotein [Streptomyces longispororuber]
MTTLYFFASAAPPAFDAARVIRDAQERGFDVCLGLTPSAAEWLADDLAELATLTGHPVRTRYKRPGDPDAWPRADVIAFAPLTFNSLNAWAQGLTTSWAVGVVAEAFGKKIPMVAMPCVNAAFAAHPQVDRSVAVLRAMGIEVLYGDGGFVPNQPGQGRPGEYPWGLVLDAAERAAARSAP